MCQKIRKNVIKPKIVFSAYRPNRCTICNENTEMKSIDFVDAQNLLEKVYPNGCSGLECSKCNTKFIFNKPKS